MSGYHAFHARPKRDIVSSRDEQDIQLIWKVYVRSRGTIGVKAISGTLKAQYDITVNHKRVARLMKEMGLKSKIRMKKWRPAVPQLPQNMVYPDLLKRDFDAQLPNTKWVADLTEFNYLNTKFYGCAIVDLFERKAVGFCLSLSPDASLVSDTLTQAVRSRDLDTLEGMILHTDQGSVFRSNEYKRLICELRFTPSMSRKANCWDNAVIESFFSQLKTEFPFHSKMESIEQIEEDLKRFITYYNDKRGQKRLNYLSPTMYYQQHVAQQNV